MKFGWLEIVLIIFVIIAVAIIARIVRSNRVPGGQKEKSGRHIKTAANTRTLIFLNRAGIVLIIAGGIAVIAAASFFRLVLQSYLWAFLAIAVGVILWRFSRKDKE